MAKSKYGEYVINDKKLLMVNLKSRDPFFQVRGIKQWPGMACQIAVAPVTQPFVMEEGPMKHDFDQILCFMGTNPKDMFEFEAEVELYLGDEAEKHVITSPTVVYVPKGLVHCPLKFKRVDKPVMFMDITLAAAYTRKEKTSGGWSKTVKDEEISAREIKKYGLK